MTSLNVDTIGTSAGGKKRELPKKGTQMARLVQVLDLGVRTRPPYKGKPKDPCRQIELLFELPNDRIEYEDKDGNTSSMPRWASTKEINVFKSATRGKLVDFMAGMDPDGASNGDLGSLAGKAVMVTITHGVIEKGPRAGQPKYTITNVVEAPEGVEVAALENDPVVFSYDNPDKEVFKSFPDWKRAKLTSSLNFKGSALETIAAQAELELQQEEEAPKAELPQEDTTPAPAPKKLAAPKPAATVADAPSVNSDGDEIPF